MHEHKKRGASPIPPASILRLLDVQERARLLILIVKAIQERKKPHVCDHKFAERLRQVWPGMFDEEDQPKE